MEDNFMFDDSFVSIYEVKEAIKNILGDYNKTLINSERMLAVSMNIKNAFNIGTHLYGTIDRIVFRVNACGEPYVWIYYKNCKGHLIFCFDNDGNVKLLPGGLNRRQEKKFISDNKYAITKCLNKLQDFSYEFPEMFYEFNRNESNPYNQFLECDGYVFLIDVNDHRNIKPVYTNENCSKLFNSKDSDEIMKNCFVIMSDLNPFLQDIVSRNRVRNNSYPRKALHRNLI